MTCTEEYKEHIEYTFHAFCKIVIRNASYTALRTWSRKHKREISLDYITDEKHYPLGTTDEYFKAPEPDEEYIVHLCGDTVILSNGLLVQALSRLPAQKQEMLYLSFFKRIVQPFSICPFQYNTLCIASSTFLPGFIPSSPHIKTPKGQRAVLALWCGIGKHKKENGNVIGCT